jgi:transcriptional regulator with XRE-family HTH domain
MAGSATTDEYQHWKKFGLWLREQRKASTYATGTPRYKLAEAIGVGDNTFANWERGGRGVHGNWVTYRPTDTNLVGIARVLGIPVEDVFRRAGIQLPAFMTEAPPKRQNRTLAPARNMLLHVYELVTKLEERVARLEKDAGV